MPAPRSPPPPVCAPATSTSRRSPRADAGAARPARRDSLDETEVRRRDRVLRTRSRRQDSVSRPGGYGGRVSGESGSGGDAGVAAAYDARATEYVELLGTVEQMDAADRALIE